MTHPHHRSDHSHPDVPERVEAILQLLRTDGGRVTTGRRAVVTALLTADDHHVTADDVAGIVQAEHPDVHLSTIYRTLDSLEHLGVVGRVTLGGGGAVYHLTDHVHHHLVCSGCGTVIELSDDSLAALAADVERLHGFALAAHPMSLHGLCSACADPAS